MSFIDWKDLFDDIFEAYSDKWRLEHVQRNNTKQNRKLQTKCEMKWTGYARFHCPKCSKQWASAKAMVIFYYPNAGESLGTVTLRFFGQQCKKCSHTNDYYVDPEFEDDSIRLILEKLYERIGWFCYGKERPPKNKIGDNQKNKINGPHEKNLCEACRSGYCDQTTIKIKR